MPFNCTAGIMPSALNDNVAGLACVAFIIGAPDAAIIIHIAQRLISCGNSPDETLGLVAKKFE